MGFSVGKVFKPIETEMRKYADVDSIELPCANYSLLSMWNNIRYAKNVVTQTHYDIVHITGTEHYLLPFLRKQKTVMTVHDLCFFTEQKFSLRSVKKYLLWIRTLPLASYVTFISEKSEREALNIVSLKEGRYATVYDPLGSEYTRHDKEINAECPVILHIGTKQNKNLESTAIALKGFPCKLRIVGRLTDEQKTALSLSGINYKAVHDLTDEEILQEYINCDYVNFPSLFEGFGMPIIEGQAVGRPVLTSNISPMVDVAGGAAMIVDPTKPNNIRRGYEEMASRHKELVTKGLKNVERFSIEKITKQFLDIYKFVLSVNK